MYCLPHRVWLNVSHFTKLKKPWKKLKKIWEILQLPLYTHVPDKSQQRTTTFITTGKSLCFCQKHSLKGNYTHQTLFHYSPISSFPFLPNTHMKGVIGKFLPSLGPDNKVWMVAQNRAGSTQDWSHSAQKGKCCKKLQKNVFTESIFSTTHWGGLKPQGIFDSLLSPEARYPGIPSIRLKSVKAWDQPWDTLASHLSRLGYCQ